MKPTVFEFAGGPWDGKTLRTDATEYEEQLLAAEYYEMSHHGAIGSECPALSYDAVGFARRHGWVLAGKTSSGRDHHYLVTERRETETELTVTFKWRPMRQV